MFYKSIGLTAIIIFSLILNTWGQVTSIGKFRTSEEPTGKSDSIRINNFNMTPCNNAVLLLGYRLGSGKSVKAVVLNNKSYTQFATDTIRKSGHCQGIIAIPIGQITRTTATNIFILLNDKASVRGAVAQLYQNVDQKEPFTLVNKSTPDTTKNLLSTIKNPKKDNVIFDLLSGKCKKQRNIDASVGAQQNLLAKPKNIRPNPSQKSGLLIMASESSVQRKKINFKWSLEKELINILYQAIIIQESKNSN